LTGNGYLRSACFTLTGSRSAFWHDSASEYRERGNMNCKNISVAGSGVLGSQIAFQTAYKGFHVNVYDISDQVLGQAKERLTKLKDDNYKEDLRATQQTVDEAFSRISFYADLAQAVADADLVIEAIPEVAKIKTDVYTQLGKVVPEKTIFATNSSTLLPSQFAEVTGRPIGFWCCILPLVFGRTTLPK
jgi:3-hydroxyacyl-CoA dehydrogenase